MSDPDYTRDGWWNDLPSVDGIPAATTREDEPDAPPEPEQHPQVVTGDETDVAFYGDQTPALLDDQEGQS